MNELIDNALRMQKCLEKKCPDNAEAMMKRLSVLNVYMAQSGKMLSDAMQLRDRAITTLYVEHKALIMKMPATIASKFINAFCEDENRLVKWLDRINRACVHQSENIRTQINFILRSKAEK